MDDKLIFTPVIIKINKVEKILFGVLLPNHFKLDIFKFFNYIRKNLVHIVLVGFV